MKEYMFIPTEMKATNRFDYECEANDVRVRYCFKDGKIDEVHIKVDGDGAGGVQRLRNLRPEADSDK